MGEEGKVRRGVREREGRGGKRRGNSPLMRISSFLKDNSNSSSALQS